MTRTRFTPPVVDGAAIMAARRKAKISRDHAAAMLGVSRSAVNAYEQGRSDPSARVLVMMAWMYRVKIERLLRPRADIEAEYAEATGPGDNPQEEDPAA